MPTDAEIDAALEAVITAARNHRTVLASTTVTPDEIWAAYVALNNASVHYDDLISDAYDEVTPWDCEYIEEEVASEEPADTTQESATTNGEPINICVRHRRDFVVSDLDALLTAATAARARQEAAGPSGQITHLGQAIYALIDAGDGTVASLDDVDELEPGNGLLLVNEISKPLAAPISEEPDAVFALTAQDRLLYRLDEVMVSEEVDEDEPHEKPR